MREIKFRAWDKRNENMWSPEFFNLRQENGEYYIVANTGHGAIKNVELMQYTGLKDKNGVEIYEGDIVRYLSGIGERVTVCAWSDDYYGWRFSGFYYELPDFEFIKVIGNIHESPELLK